MTLSRRRLLIAGWPALLAVSGLSARDRQGLEQFALAGPPCEVNPALTPAVPRDARYRPGSPARRQLAVAGRAEAPLTFSGTVTGLTCGRISGARVDVWHADGRGTYDMTGWRCRGHQLTDQQGQFRFETIVPGRAAGRAPHVGLHVFAAGRVDFATELFFPHEPGEALNAADPRFQPGLLLKVLASPRGKTATFDVILDV